METGDSILEPDRPIIDPHLHLWDIGAGGSLQEPQTFLLAEAARTLAECGHRITHSVYVECHAMYRTHGDPALRSLGETEFANGMAAMSASGGYGAPLIAHRIVANVDLCLGDALAPVLERHQAAAGERFRGVRMNTAFAAIGLFGAPAEPAAAGRLGDPAFIEGARLLARLGLSLDVWCLHQQLPQLIALADALPELVIVLDHLGTPDFRSGEAEEIYRRWLADMRALAERPNVRVKLSGLGMDIDGPIRGTVGTATPRELAERWRRFVAPVVDAFTPQRCMFASNYPPDQVTAGYGAIWNGFKHLASGYGEAEKDWLFRRTAAQTYDIDLERVAD